MSKKEFIHPPVAPLSGDEMFMMGREPRGFNIRHFWSYMYSNVLDNTGDLAEFIVAAALGIKFNKKYGWTLYDIDYRDKRIEVKATAYVQPWRADGNYSEQRVFSIRKTHTIEGDMNSPLARNSDVYVFVLNTAKKMEEANPLNLEQWCFWVIRTEIINALCGENKTISLKKIQDLGGDGVTFDELKLEINMAIDEL